MNLMLFQNPKMFVHQQKKETMIIVEFCYKLYLSGIKLSISASGQRQSRPEWIET